MNPHKTRSTIRAELETIRQRNGGLLDPAKIVEFARNRKTALHEHFCWDDTEAAREYRIEQARRVIRVHVTILPGSESQVRAYVSLEPDRANGGYRTIEDVLGDSELRRQLIDQAHRDMQIFSAKYQALSELTPVLRAMARVQSVAGKRRAKASKTGRNKQSAAA